MNAPHKVYENGPLKRVWAKLNEVIDYSASMRLGRGRGTQVRRTRHGQIVIADNVTDHNDDTVVQQFRLVDVFDDYITAQTWDGENAGGTVQIAKPYRLRKTPFHNQLITIDATTTVLYVYTTVNRRTATITVGGTATTENQLIVPDYRNRTDLIYATKPNGGTGVTVGAAVLTWLDLNCDARAWACY